MFDEFDSVGDLVLVVGDASVAVLGNACSLFLSADLHLHLGLLQFCVQGVLLFAHWQLSHTPLTHLQQFDDELGFIVVPVGGGAFLPIVDDASASVFDIVCL